MSSPDWILRVASRPEAGGGHVMRCLALAHALIAHGPVTFMLDPDGMHWQPRLKNAGFDSIADDGRHAPVRAILLDSYEPGLMARWRAGALRLATIHDGTEPPPEPDLVVLPWVEAAAMPHVVSGLDYVLMDARYAGLADPVLLPLPARVLVSFGRRDSANATGRVLASLSRLAVRGWVPEIRVVLGSEAPHLRSVAAATTALGHRAHLLVDVPGLVELVSQSDLVIGAGGVSAVERAAAGRPSATITIADNQRASAILLADRTATRDLGPAGELGDSDLDASLLALARDADERAAQTRYGRLAVDGRGAERVAAALARL